MILCIIFLIRWNDISTFLILSYLTLSTTLLLFTCTRDIHAGDSRGHAMLATKLAEQTQYLCIHTRLSAIYQAMSCGGQQIE